MRPLALQIALIGSLAVGTGVLAIGCKSTPKKASKTKAATRPTGPFEPSEIVDRINHGFPIDRNAVVPPTDLYQMYPPADYPERYYLNLPPGRSEVYWRLMLLRANRRFHLQPKDFPPLLECMSAPNGELAGRMCAASLLLDLGNEDARKFLKSELSSTDRPKVHNATDAIAVHVLRGYTDEWSIDTLLVLIRDASLLEPYAAGFETKQAFSFDPSVYFSFAFDSACDALGASHNAKAIPALQSVLERYPQNQYARRALENLRANSKK